MDRTTSWWMLEEASTLPTLNSPWKLKSSSLDVRFITYRLRDKLQGLQKQTNLPCLMASCSLPTETRYILITPMIRIPGIRCRVTRTTSCGPSMCKRTEQSETEESFPSCFYRRTYSIGKASPPVPMEWLLILKATST